MLPENLLNFQLLKKNRNGSWVNPRIRSSGHVTWYAWPGPQAGWSCHWTAPVSRHVSRHAALAEGAADSGDSGPGLCSRMTDSPLGVWRMWEGSSCQLVSSSKNICSKWSLPMRYLEGRTRSRERGGGSAPKPLTPWDSLPGPDTPWQCCLHPLPCLEESVACSADTSCLPGQTGLF